MATKHLRTWWKGQKLMLILNVLPVLVYAGPVKGSKLHPLCVSVQKFTLKGMTQQWRLSPSHTCWPIFVTTSNDILKVTMPHQSLVIPLIQTKNKGATFLLWNTMGRRAVDQTPSHSHSHSHSHLWAIWSQWTRGKCKLHTEVSTACTIMSTEQEPLSVWGLVWADSLGLTAACTKEGIWTTWSIIIADWQGQDV